MNWNKKHDQLAAVIAAQQAKFEEVRALLFGAQPKPPANSGFFSLKSVHKKCKKSIQAKPKKRKESYRWTDTYTWDEYEGYTRPTRRRVWSWMPGFKKNEVKKDFSLKPFSCADHFKQTLKRRGFERLGSGVFSTVYAKPGSDRVIKVTHRPDNWIDYCIWGAQKGYAGNLSPMVYSYKKYGEGCDEFSVAVVERMRKTVSHVGKKEDHYILQSLLSNYLHSENIMCGLFLDELAPGLPDFGTTLQKTFGSLDLHGGNIMVRSNGSICVTDPVTDIEGSEVTPKSYTRLKASDFTSLAKAIGEMYENILYCFRKLEELSTR